MSKRQKRFSLRFYETDGYCFTCFQIDGKPNDIDIWTLKFKYFLENRVVFLEHIEDEKIMILSLYDYEFIKYYKDETKGAKEDYKKYKSRME